MSQVTTLEIGGEAKEFLEAQTEDQLTEAIKSAQLAGKKYLVIGGGSNLLVSDEGVDKLIIKNSLVGLSKDGQMVTVKAGTPLQQLVDFTIENGLAGLQKMTGIPGTVGGAIYGNAGAYGQTISDHLILVKAFDGEKIISLAKDECNFGYRDSAFKKNGFTILEATFDLSVDGSDKLRQAADDTLSKRLVKYPAGLKCPGSFFKNILAETLPNEILAKIPIDKIPYGKVSVGYLLEEVGAKGAKKGNIEVAPYHANLFVNKGDGKASDFYELAKDLAVKVKQKFGITLEPEVQLVNLPPLV